MYFPRTTWVLLICIFIEWRWKLNAPLKLNKCINGSMIYTKADEREEDEKEEKKKTICK